MKSWIQGIAGLLGGLLAAGVILLASQPPKGESVRLLPPPTLSPLMVYVTGAVHSPDVYALSAGSRVRDAIQAAGGARPEADLRAFNLAARLEDGQRIDVPHRAPTPDPRTPQSSLPTPSLAPAGLTGRQDSLVNINTATLEELDRLPGIGPAIGQRILDYRQQHGPFANIEAIQDVPGIGPAIYERLKSLITVDGVP